MSEPPKRNLMPPHPASASAAARPKGVSADGAFLRTMASLWPYMWPAERPDLRMRVVFAFGLLVVTKLVTLLVPYTLKWATDGLAALSHGASLTGSSLTIALASLPMTMIVLYGVARILMTGVAQWKDGLFAAVFMHAVRRLGVETFEHIHN